MSMFIWKIRIQTKKQKWTKISPLACIRNRPCFWALPMWNDAPKHSRRVLVVQAFRPNKMRVLESSLKIHRKFTGIFRHTWHVIMPPVTSYYTMYHVTWCDTNSYAQLFLRPISAKFPGIFRTKMVNFSRNNFWLTFSWLSFSDGRERMSSDISTTALWWCSFGIFTFPAQI